MGKKRADVEVLSLQACLIRFLSQLSCRERIQQIFPNRSLPFGATSWKSDRLSYIGFCTSHCVSSEA